MAKATSNMDAIKKKLDRIYSALIVMGIIHLVVSLVLFLRCQ